MRVLTLINVNLKTDVYLRKAYKLYYIRECLIDVFWLTLYKHLCMGHIQCDHILNVTDVRHVILRD